MPSKGIEWFIFSVEITNWASMRHQIKAITICKHFPLRDIQAPCLLLKHLGCNAFHQKVQVSQKSFCATLKNNCPNIPFVYIYHCNCKTNKIFKPSWPHNVICNKFETLNCIAYLVFLLYQKCQLQRDNPETYRRNFPSKFYPYWSPFSIEYSTE